MPPVPWAGGICFMRRPCDGAAMMILITLLLATPAAPRAAAPGTGGLLTLAQGPRQQILAAKDMLGRCRFSQIIVVDAAGGRAELRVPARALGPKQAACANVVAGEHGLADVKWFGPDLRQH